MPRNKKKEKVRSVRPVLHIFCEGEKTEPNYLEHYKDLFCVSSSSIKVERTKKNTPVQLVEEAKKLKKTNSVSEKDEYWVVYDRESDAKYDEALHAKARDTAKANGINIALSNVCFEVWLLLHKQSTCAVCDNCDALVSRSDFKAAYPRYEKGASCSVSKDEIQEARKRAKKMNSSTKNGANREWTVPSLWNPYTDVYKLLDAIDAFIKRNTKEV